MFKTKDGKARELSLFLPSVAQRGGTVHIANSKDMHGKCILDIVLGIFNSVLIVLSVRDDVSSPNLDFQDCVRLCWIYMVNPIESTTSSR